jgi:TP901 family phage tail tape measure protein
MAENLSRRINIYVNSGEAEKAYERLEKSNQRLTSSEQKAIDKTKQLQQQLNNIDKNTDPKAYRKLQKDLSDATKALDANRDAQKKNAEEMVKIQKKLSGEMSPTYNDLSKSVGKLTRELKNMSETDPAFKSKLAELTQAKKEMQGFSDKIFGARTAYKDFFGDVKSIALGTMVAGGLTGAAGAISGFVTGAMDQGIEREKARREVQSITGVTDQELLDLDARAKALSKITLESGKAFSTSTNDIYEAFKLVGSAKPELLKNIPALEQTTREVLILAKASGLDLASSTRAVTSILNQFNLGADKSGRVINALAKGAQEGAKEIPWLTDAFEKVGPIAANSNMTIEQTIAALEVLGLSMDESSVAGNGLKNVILELQKEGYGKMADGTFNFGKAMEEVNQKITSNVDVINVFGKESAVAALIAKQNTNEYNRLVTALDGTNAAYEQASTMTITLEEQKKEFTKALQNTTLAISKGITPALSFLFSTGVKVLNGFSNLPELFNRFKIAIALAGIAILEYNRALLINIGIKSRAAVSTFALVAAEKIQNVVSATRNTLTLVGNNLYGIMTGRIKMATAAQMLFNASISTLIIPITAIVGLFYALKKGVEIYNESTESAVKLTNLKTQSNIEIEKAMKNSSAVYDEINGKIGNFLMMSAKEQKALEDKIIAQKSLLQAQFQSIKVQKESAMELAGQKEKESVGNKIEDIMSPDWAPAAKKRQDMLIGKQVEQAKRAEREVWNAKLKATEEEIKKYDDALAQIEQLRNTKNNVDLGGGAGGGGTSSGKDAKKEDAKRKQEDFLKEIQKLQEEHTLALMNEDQKELYNIDKKYKDLKAKLDEAYPVMNDAYKAYLAELERLKIEENNMALGDQNYKAELAAKAVFIEDSKNLLKEQYANGSIDHEMYTNGIEALDIQLLEERTNVAKRFADIAKKACEDVTIFEKEEHDKRIQNEIKAREESVRLAKELEERKAQFELDVQARKATRTLTPKDDMNAEIAALDYKYNKQVEAAKNNSDLITQIEEEREFYIDEVKENYKQKDEDRRKDANQKLLGSVLEYAGMAQQLFNGFMNFENAKLDNQLVRDKKANDQKKRNYGQMLKNKEISQEQHDEMVMKADEELRAKEAIIKKKQWENDKKARLVNVFMDTAAAVAKTLASVPFPGNLIAGGVIGALGALQFAQIASQEPPEFREGADFGDNSTLLKGPSHENGGMGVYDQSGKKIAEFEGDELLLSKRFKDANPELIDPLLESARAGKPLYQYLPTYKMPMPRVSSQRVTENVSYAKGANFEKSNVLSETGKDKEMKVSVDFSELIDVNKKMLDELAEVKKNSKMDYEEWAKETARFNKLIR